MCKSPLNFRVIDDILIRSLRDRLGSEEIDQLFILEKQLFPFGVGLLANDLLILDSINQKPVKLELQDRGNLIKEALRVCKDFCKSPRIAKNTHQR